MSDRNWIVVGAALVVLGVLGVVCAFLLATDSRDGAKGDLS